MSTKMYLVLVLAFLVAGCAPAPAQPTTEVTLLATEFKYVPASITVPQGEPVTLTLKNDGNVEHDFVVQKIGVADVQEHDHGNMSGHDMESPEYDLHISAMPGGSGVITFTSTETGTYQFLCTVKGHKEAGMVGTLVVAAEE